MQVLHAVCIQQLIDETLFFSDITSGKLKVILDILWLIILHFEIHSASEFLCELS